MRTGYRGLTGQRVIQFLVSLSVCLYSGGFNGTYFLLYEIWLYNKVNIIHFKGYYVYERTASIEQYRSLGERETAE